jgi:hypothetical protein
MTLSTTQSSVLGFWIPFVLKRTVGLGLVDRSVEELGHKISNMPLSLPRKVRRQKPPGYRVSRGGCGYVAVDDDRNHDSAEQKRRRPRGRPRRKRHSQRTECATSNNTVHTNTTAQNRNNE